VVSGITMSFQFGTNWPGFMETVGNIAGPLLAYEVLTAFFLEATFLGIMLFGFQRVGNRMHTVATVLVAVGTSMSAFWILALNSWMHTPAGFEMIDGRAHAADWFAIVFNPSFPYRLTHMMIASGLTTAFLIAGISAWRWLRGDHAPSVMATLKVGSWLGAILIPVQIAVGDLHGLNTLEHQPAKIAAIEGIWETERGAPLLLFALPNAQTRSNDYAIGLPNVASLVLTHEWDGEIKGLSEFDGLHPPVAPVFWAFRVMVGIGMLMLAVSWLSAWKLRRTGTLPRPLARILVAMTFSGWVATVAGWYVTEIGRQPWLVQGVLATADAASAVPAVAVGTTLALYLTLYILLLIAYIGAVFHLARKGDQASVYGTPGRPAPLPGGAGA
jgi:cytochrome d ubiquinol oxidase subunit I